MLNSDDSNKNKFPFYFNNDNKNKYDFNLNLSESSPNFNNNFIKKNYNNYSKNNHQTQKDIQDLLNPLKNNQKIASLFHINMKQIYSTIDQ